MFWRGLSFTHAWIALGAFVTTTFSWMWDVEGFPMERGGMQAACWVALSTGLGYTIQRGIKHARNPETMPPLRRAFWDRWKWAMVVIWGGAWTWFTVASAESLRWDHPERLWVVVGLGIASLGYAFVPGTQGGFRNVVGLKVPLIAGVWATATTHHPELGLDPLLWVQRFLFVAGLTLPFDIRDLDVDRPHMTTLPMVASTDQVLRWARFLLAASAALSLAAWGVRTWTHGFRPVDAGPMVVGLQGLWAWWLLRPKSALPRLTAAAETTRERFTGWTLDGVLVMPYVVLWLMYLMLLFVSPVLRGW